MSGYRNYYESTYGRRNETPKKNDDKSTTSRIATKYSGAYSAGYQRDTGVSREPGRTETSRIKPLLDKKDTLHPPVSYRPLTRTGARSRDPSPVDKSEKSSSTSTSSYNANRLYPRPYTRSVSGERLDGCVSPTTIPSYSGRTSISKDDIPKYSGRSSIGRDEPVTSSRYKSASRTTSREDLSFPQKYSSRSSSSRDDTPKYAKKEYNTASRTTSREDLSNPQKYINSRFLPKNSVEKSYTAYTRPSTIRTNETSRRNKELLSVLHAQQEQERLSRPASRCSSVAPEEPLKLEPFNNPVEHIEMETITVITRGTSPTPTTSQTSFLRSRRIEIAKLVEKQISRPKVRPEMVDKEIQSDRLDDSTKSSRFAGTSRISATPWSSFLDMKFNSPSIKQKQSKKSESPETNPDRCDSPKSVSRTSSTKSLSQGSSKSEGKTKDKKSPSPSFKSKITPPKQVHTTDKKLLPPQIPKNENIVKNPAHSLNAQNKDFRKSVLNMNPDGKGKKKLGRRSTSASSADSDQSAADPEATDVSENLATCKSYHTHGSKLPQKIPSLAQRTRRSPSSDGSTSSSNTSSEDDTKHKSKSVGSSRTSMILSSADELSIDKSQKGTKTKDGSKPETVEAKSFLMRALAPVTNLFKGKPHEVQGRYVPPDEVIEIEAPQPSGKPVRATLILAKVESDDKQPWPSENSVQTSSANSSGKSSKNLIQIQTPKPFMRHADSGELPWWLDDKSEVPEGVDTYPNYVKEDGTTQEGKVIFKIRHNDSDESSWWLDSSDKSKSASNKQNIISSSDIKEYGKADDGRIIYKIRHNDSDDTSWWIDSSDKTNTDSNKQSIMNNEYFEHHKIRHIDSGERAWWLSSAENIPEMVQPQVEQENRSKYAIRHQESSEKPWWLDNDVKKESDNESDNEIPLGDRASPEGLEMPKDEGRLSPYDNVPEVGCKSKKPVRNLFISRHTNIDEILGGSTQLWSPVMDKMFNYDEATTEIDARQVIIHENSPQRGVIHPNRIDSIGGFPKAFSPYGKYLNDIDPFSYTTNFPDPARPPLHTFSVTLPLINQLAAVHRLLKSPHRLDDAALQLYKDGDYGSYLDLEASISEQQEEFEGFQSNKKNSIVLRTQLSVRVHTIIEKLLTSEGRELRRALFSLKQIFQEDKDLVHEFVQNDGLSCLIKVGSEADQNYQNYILRALGQVMLYVDGMNGVMEHNQTIQWLYSLISSKFRLVVKTALKLLLVFVEYTDSNCMLLIKAIHSVDYSQGLLPYHNIMKLLKDFDSADTELLIYATTLINKLLNGVPDQDTYYDQTDALEEQGIEAIIQRYMSKPGTDLDLLQQFQIYEAVLQYEDGEDIGTPIRHLDENLRKTLRNRKSVGDNTDRRKSRRHSTGNTPLYGGLNNRNNINNNLLIKKEDDESSSSQSSEINSQLNGSYKDSNKAVDVGVTPALKRRRERAERQRSFMREQQESAALLKGPNETEEENNKNIENGNYTTALQQRIANGNNVMNGNYARKDLTPLLNAVNKLDSEDSLTKQPWILSMIQNQENIEESEIANENDRKLILQLRRENTVKDLTQKLANQNILHSPSEDNKVNRIGDMSGLISKAKEGLAKSKSKADVLKSPTNENVPKIEIKKSENELRWEELASNLNRSLNLCDMDFTDLATDDENDVLAPAAVTNGIPPPPPPLRDMGPAPPPPPLAAKLQPPIPPPVFGVNLSRPNKPNETKIPIKKNKKTVKLFWKEVRDDPISTMKLKTGFIWDELKPVSVDTQKLEHLFESRAKDLITKKQQEMNKNKEIIVLDPKRSNAINIGMTKLPPPRSIKTAILKMDATIMNREGIEKLLTMLPTEEERTKIQEAQAANPDLPLGSAEQFLLTLASISELPARLKLWAFKLDFENSEREIAEPLMDLKQGFEVLKANKTFRGILSTLLSIGNFLNGNEVKGFQIEYLAKVPEVKDTVHKHSLLHHLCHIVMDKFPDATDLYSEIGAITRASKVDFDELTLNIQRLEADCKASWDHLKLIAKHDGSTMMKVKMSDFLADCAERIILLGIIHRRIMNRFHKFLLWLGVPLHQIGDTKPNEFSRIISEFALEYRTTRERVLQQLEKKANHRERNKTRGKMITDIGKFRTKEDRADAELRQLLGSDMSDVESMQGTLPWRRTRRDNNRLFMSPANGNMTDGDDEILESLVKTATKGSSRTAPRERKRTRHADRKSLRRTLKNGLSEEEKKHLSACIKGY